MDLKSHADNATRALEMIIQDAARHYDGGAMAIAERLQMKSGKALCNKLNPNSRTATLNIRDLIGVMSVLAEEQRHHVLLAFNQLFDHVSMPVSKLGDVSDEELLDSWAAWDAERGETAKQIREALKDRSKRTVRRINDNEFRTIRQEMIEDIQKELELLRRLEVT